MEFLILGPVEVRAAGKPVALGGTKVRALLAMLLLHANRPLSAERLVAGLWGEEAPAGATKTLQVHVSRLRKALGDGATVETTAAGYCIRVGPGELDADRFEELCERGRRALAAEQPADAAALLREALTLWRGAPLSDLLTEPFAAPEIRRLEDLRLDRTELALDAELAAGRHREVVSEIEALAAAHPLRERLHAQRMLALYRCGRQAEALDAFRQTRATLVGDIGVEPGPELRRLHESILRHDAALDFAPLITPDALPPELDITAAPALAGRDDELAWLRDRWARARAGTGALLAVLGPPGIGKTRLAAELASEAHESGASVRYAPATEEARTLSGALALARRGARPVLVVLDGADRHANASRDISSDLSSLPMLALMLGTEVDGSPAEDTLRLEPLDIASVRAIALAHAPGHDVPAARLLQASGGIPARVHELASEWAEAETARRVVAASGRAADGRAALRSVEAELAGTVVELQALRGRGGARARADAPVVCPFKGLASFNAEDAPYFFGRERLVAELVARLVGAPLLAVVGPSGSGKSSVVRAGLLPALAAGVLPGSDTWTHALMRPGEHPLRELHNITLDGDRRVLLVVDQFEETFTACRDPGERAAFVDALVRAVGEPARSVAVVAIRADLYGACAAFPALADLVGANQVLVGPMREKELRRAVEGPAQQAALRVDPELVDALVADVAGEPGALPLLSSTLLELWQLREGREMHLAAYERLAGVHGAVARLAENAFGRLEPAQQAGAKTVLLRLAGEGPGGELVRRRVSEAELGSADDEDVAHVLEVLAARRLLTVSSDGVEVAHEALLREWPRLRGWLQEDVEGRRIQRHLADAARDWDERGHERSDLYRGARLAVAQEWRKDHEAALNPAERRFLHASRAESGRAVRRLRVVAGGALVLVLVAIAGALVALSQRSHARAEARAAEAQRLGVQALLEPRMDRALLLARQGVALDDSVATRSNLLTALLRSPAAIGVIRGDGTPLAAVDAAPDGYTLALGGVDGKVIFVDPATSRSTARPYLAGKQLSDLRYSPDGTRLAVSTFGDNAGRIDLLDGRTHTRIRRLSVGPGGGFGVPAFSPDSRVLVVDGDVPGTTHRFIGRWDARSGRELGSLGPVSVDALAGFTANGTQLVTVGPRKGTVIRDATTLRPVRRLPGGSGPAAVSPDGRTLAFGGSDGALRLLDLRTGRLRQAVGRHDGYITGLRFTPDSRMVVTGGGDRRVIVWDVRRAAAVETLEGHAGGVGQLSVSPDGKTAFSSGADGSVFAWDLIGHRRLGRLFAIDRTQHDPWVSATADGARFAIPDRPGHVAVFDSHTLKRIRRLRIGAHGLAWRGEIGPDGTSLAVEDAHDRLQVWDVRTGKARLRHSLALHGLSTPFSTDGRWLAFDDGFAAHVVNLRDGRHFKTPTKTSPDLVADLSLSPDGTRLAVTTQRDHGHGELDILTVPRLAVVARVRTTTGTWGRYADNGRVLLFGDMDGRAWVYDTRTWHPRGSPLPGQGDPIVTIDLSRDGRTLATASDDGAARLWDLGTRREIGTPLRGTADLSASAMFVDDDTHLVLVDGAGGAYLWDVRPAAWARRACAVAGRALTRAEWDEALPERAYAPACDA